MALGKEPDQERARLRRIMETVDREISGMRRSSSGDHAEAPPGGLVASWDELVKALALGAAPELRECPVCHHLGMRAATLCGYCWTKLAPLPAPAGARNDEPT